MLGYLPYLVFVFASIGLCFVRLVFKGRNAKRACLILTLILFFVLAVLKGRNVGIDTKAYFRLYESYKNASFSDLIVSQFPEVGFYSIAWLFSNLSIPFEVFQGFNYLIIVICLYFVFHRFDNSSFQITFYLLIAFLSFSFSAIRQAIAISILNLAVVRLMYSGNRRRLPKITSFCLMVFLATSFHVSSILLLVLPFAVLFGSDLKRAAPLVLFVPVLVFLFPGFSYFFYDALAGFGYTVMETRISYKGILFFVFTILLLLYNQQWFRDFFKLDRFSSKITYSSSDNIMFLLLLFLDATALINYYSLVFARLSLFFYLPLGYFLSKISDSINSSKYQFVFRIAALLFAAIYFIYDLPTLEGVPYEFI